MTLYNMLKNTGADLAVQRVEFDDEIKADHEIINKIIQEFADKIVIDSTFTTIIGISDYEATEIIRRVGDAKEVYQKR